MSLVPLLLASMPHFSTGQQARESLRPPAVPLLTSDPYLSVWSEADNATDDVTRHWTHRPHPLVSLIRVDGVTYRILGKSASVTQVLPQTNLKVFPTRTTYVFENSKVTVVMSFLTPSLPDDLDVFARPVTYLTWDVTSNDGQKHDVQVFESSSGLLTVNEPNRKIEWKRESMGDLTALRIGAADQTYLRPAGDDARIDWGYLYGVAKTSQAKSAIGANQSLESDFTNTGTLSGNLDSRMPRSADDDQPAVGFAFSLGSVGKQTVSRHMMIGYDEIYAIEYYGKKLRPFWRRNGAEPADLFKTAEKDYDTLRARCQKFDSDLVADAEQAGGDKYAKILALSYRECVAANGLAADANKQPLYFTKENTSNGDIATVDVIYPMAPIWLLLSPTLMKASLVSNFMYAGSPHWKFPNAPHDLGTYPQVTGRDDGGEGMPVEESANMILMTDAIAQIERSPSFANLYWPQLTQWATYLEKYGLDPENQLCTDDFMGHLAHNANLSVKAILGLAAYGDLCKMRGETAKGKKFTDLALADAKHWMSVAIEGDHSVLAFDRPGTWSQKYNLVWDQLLNLGIFPDSVREMEIAYYKTKMLKYGLPLDSRTKLTKTDWSIWSATMATNQSDFETIVNPIFDYVNETTTRDPIADSYITDNPKSGGMHARPVVGGFFIKMLDDRSMWRRWAKRDTFKLGKYAPLPKPPVIENIIASGKTSEPTWAYTTMMPAPGWEAAGFDDGDWAKGKAGFGTNGTPGIEVRTEWKTGDIWMRRTVTLPKADYAKAVLYGYHDEDVEVYFNGVLAGREGGFVTNYGPITILSAAKKLLKPGAKVTIAVHCHQTSGGQGVDIGLGLLKEEG
ncbi:MAG: DUF4965 domain-containing protein [Armatimonadetes bacterium]|nr:DUF4965 domain-containing protein [Armatimonadota bacterium]